MFSALVSAVLNPDRWVPPSRVLMVLAKLKMFSTYASLYCIASSSLVWFRSLDRWITGCSAVLFWLIHSTNDLMPPSYLKLCSLSLRSSFTCISSVELRNASSRSLLERVSKLYWVVSNISLSGVNVIFVPVFVVVPVSWTLVVGLPLR